MNQLPRLISLLTLLNSKRVLTATEISEKFEISVRTVYRDIRKLEEAGVPIFTIEAVGYSLMEGYTVAPVQFSEKEANALVTSQTLVEKSKDKSFVGDFEQAMVKIKSVFKSSVLEKSEVLSKKMHVLEYQEDDFDSNALSEIQLAITNLKFVEINYQKANNSNISFRKIEPYAILSNKGKWILMAWCHLRNEYRAFRIDRFKHFKILNKNFKDRKFDLLEYFRKELEERGYPEHFKRPSF